MGVEGYADHRIGAALLAGRIVNVHIKNVVWEAQPDGRWWHRWSPCDIGTVDVPGALRILRAQGYDGWVCLEDFSTTRAEPDKLRHARALMRDWL
jgi:sugar phosphate isomerase/epimerase